MPSWVIAAQLVILVAIVAVSVWGWTHMPNEARVRARAGTTGWDYTMSKKTTLVLSPAIALFIFLGTLAMRHVDDPDTIALLGLTVMIIFFLSHLSAIRRAAR